MLLFWEQKTASDVTGTTLEFKGWDVFRLLPPRPGDIRKGILLDISLQLLKLLTYPVVFCLLLGGILVSKATFLFMTSAIGQAGTNATLCPDIEALEDSTNATSTVFVESRHVVKYAWAVFLTLCAPEMFCFIRCLQRIFFRNVRKPTVGQFFTTFIVEILVAFGMGTLAFRVLPSLDAVAGAMFMSSLMLLPSVFGLLSRRAQKLSLIYVILDLLAIGGQSSGIWALALFVPGISAHYNLWAIPVSGILCSLAFWENYVDRQSVFPCIRNLASHAERLKQVRSKTYVLVAPTKCLIYLCCLLGYMSFRHPLSTLFLPNPFAAATINVRINVPGEQARFTPDPFLASGFNGRHDVPLEPDTAGDKRFLNSHVINPLPDEWKDRLIHDPKIDTSKANKTRRLKTSEEWPRRHYEPSLPTDPDLLADQAKRSSYAYEKIYSTTASSRKGTQYTWSGAKGSGDDIYAIKRSENDMFPPNSDDSEPEGPGRMKRQVIYQGTDFEIRQFYTTPLDALWVFLLTSLSGFFCYQCAKFACKVTMQRLCFALPINVAAVALVFILDSVCLHRHVDPCFFSTFLPHEIFWSCPPARELEFDIIRDPKIWFWAIWVVSQAWVTIHIWLPKSERLADTDRLFVMPWYSGVIIEQTLAMNRTRDDTSKVKSEEIDLDADNTTSIYDTISKVSMQSFDNTSAARTVVPPVNALPPKKSMDSITRIYACATMWHETREEMLCMLKSIFRLDEDQCARRNAQKYLKVVDPDYYEVEAHIMFDDAFETNEYGEPVVNRFVRQLLDVIDIAAGAVHQITMRIKCPRKCATPYGGRLQWILPGKNKLTVHLKDKNRIRVRKRWSQVMYMYYLLGHRLMECEGDIKRKEVIAENSYILTLDGDVDFQPHSVQLLVDLMRKNRRLGAACGRIHPRGSGPMVWYQKFEYAIGHWFQKATEHMIGCVLCSPGCFSLFRTSALMDDNVLRRYATKAEKARDYIQYDQGEDRWLCTLLLQRGYRVEYSAASDALTFAPQSFTEFFNQRRRWMPSTIANIMDLLSDYKSVIRLNDSISIW